MGSHSSWIMRKRPGGRSGKSQDSKLARLKGEQPCWLGVPAYAFEAGEARFAPCHSEPSRKKGTTSGICTICHKLVSPAMAEQKEMWPRIMGRGLRGVRRVTFSNVAPTRPAMGLQSLSPHSHIEYCVTMQSLLDLDALEAHLAHINLSELLQIDSAYIDEVENMSSVSSSTRPTGSSLPYMEAVSEHAGDPEVSSAPDSAPVVQVCS